jgi:hypothetical protein
MICIRRTHMSDPHDEDAVNTATAAVGMAADELPWDTSRITTRLYVGEAIAGEEHLRWLMGQGVTHVISVARELSDAALCARHRLGFYHVRWHDDGTVKPASDFLEALAWVLKMDAGALALELPLPRYYLHCLAGLYRSPLLATFLLAALAGMDADAAYAAVKAKRPQANAFDEKLYRASCVAALRAVASSGVVAPNPSAAIWP